MGFITQGDAEADAAPAVSISGGGSRSGAAKGVGFALHQSDPHSTWARVAHLLPFLILAVTVVVCVLLLYPSLSAIPFHVFKNYNEGWNAYQASYAMSGMELYRPVGDLVSNNYPPLSFYIVGLLSLLFGDPIIVGRVVSVVALLVVCLNIGLIIRSQGNRWLAPVFFGIGFLTYCAGLFSTYVGMDDPAWLAHAVMTSGFVLFLYNRNRGRIVALAAAVMVTAGLIKHNLLPMPLAITFWLLFNDRKMFRIWLASAVICSAAAVLAMLVVFGPNLFTEILIAPRVYSFDKLVQFFDRVQRYGLIIPGLVCLLIVGVLVLTTMRNAAVRLFVLYFVFSALMTIAVLPAAGIGQSALFDLVISAVCLLGVCVQRFEASLKPAYANSVLAATMLAVLLPALVMLPQKMRGIDWINDLRSREVETASDVDFIKKHPGPVLCEDPSICFWSSKQYVLDFFMGGQKMRGGVINVPAFIERVNNKEFALIQYMPNGMNGKPRLPQEVNEAIAQNYRVARTSDNGTFMVPDTMDRGPTT